jgi:hypothetical protein
MKFMEHVPWIIIVIACLTVGLAPFNPPHVYSKLIMLFRGDIRTAVDAFDLFLHASPWIMLVMKLMYVIVSRRGI